MPDKKSPKHIGRPPKHGAYSVLARAELLKREPRIAEHLEDVRTRLTKWAEAGKGGLTTGKAILISRVVSKEAILRLVENYVASVGVLDGDQLQSTLRESYLAYANSQRLDLAALGLTAQTLQAMGGDDQEQRNIGPLIIQVVHTRPNSDGILEPSAFIGMIPAHQGDIIDVEAEPSDDQLEAAILDLEKRLADARAQDQALGDAGKVSESEPDGGIA